MKKDKGFSKSKVIIISIIALVIGLFIGSLFISVFSGNNKEAKMKEDYSQELTPNQRIWHIGVLMVGLAMIIHGISPFKYMIYAPKGYIEEDEEDEDEHGPTRIRKKSKRE